MTDEYLEIVTNDGYVNKINKNVMMIYSQTIENTVKDTGNLNNDNTVISINIPTDDITGDDVKKLCAYLRLYHIFNNGVSSFDKKDEKTHNANTNIISDFFDLKIPYDKVYDKVKEIQYDDETIENLDILLKMSEYLTSHNDDCFNKEIRWRGVDCWMGEKYNINVIADDIRLCSYFDDIQLCMYLENPSEYYKFHASKLKNRELSDIFLPLIMSMDNNTYTCYKICDDNFGRYIWKKISRNDIQSIIDFGLDKLIEYGYNHKQSPATIRNSNQDIINACLERKVYVERFEHYKFSIFFADGVSCRLYVSENNTSYTYPWNYVTSTLSVRYSDCIIPNPSSNMTGFENIVTKILGTSILYKSFISDMKSIFRGLSHHIFINRCHNYPCGSSILIKLILNIGENMILQLSYDDIVNNQPKYFGSDIRLVIMDLTNIDYKHMRDNIMNMVRNILQNSKISIIFFTSNELYENSGFGIGSEYKLRTDFRKESDQSILKSLYANDDFAKSLNMGFGQAILNDIS